MSDPERPRFSIFGIIVMVLLLIISLVFFSGVLSFFFDEEEIECDPELDDCDRPQIIVRFIGNYEQLLTYT